MRFAVFIDDLLGRKSIMLEEDLYKESLTLYEADSWEEAVSRIPLPGPDYAPALICLPIHAAYITYIDDIDVMLLTGSDAARKKTDKATLVYDPLGIKKRKMLNREIREGPVLKDIVAGNLIVFPESDISNVYENYGSGQVFIFDRYSDEIRTVRCSKMALTVLRENNISIIG